MFSKRARRPLPALYSVGLICLLFSLPVVTGPTPPPLDCPSYILMDPETGEVIYGRNIHAQRAPASTTKIMTALLAIELGNPDDLVAISYNADGENGASLGLTEGERVPLDDLTWAMLVRSGNDAAVAVAEHIGGSVDGFCNLMNQRAQDLGMLDSFFVNPNGMPDRPLERHNSTAFDLAILAREAMTHPEFRQWVSTSELTFERFGEREDVDFESTNQLLEDYPLCDGIKTGYTDRAGFCLVASATYRGKTLIAVVLGCERNTQWSQAMALFDYGFTLYDPDYEAFRELFDRNVIL